MMKNIKKKNIYFGVFLFESASFLKEVLICILSWFLFNMTIESLKII